VRRMAISADDAERRQHFLRGTADLLLLATIARAPGHAYELATRLSDVGLGPFSYGTVYPLIARLRSAGLLSEAAHPSTRGPARKVYDLTAAGRSTLQRWSQQWQHLHQATSSYLESSTADPPGDRSHRDSADATTTGSPTC